MPRPAAIALDAGAQDGLAGGTRASSQILASYGIDHTLEIYDPGDHVNRVDERVERFGVPFFSTHLDFP